MTRKTPEGRFKAKFIAKLFSMYPNTVHITSDTRGAPDSIFLLEGLVFFVEFKSEEGSLGQSQKYFIRKMKRAGTHCNVVGPSSVIVLLCQKEIIPVTIRLEEELSIW